MSPAVEAWSLKHWTAREVPLPLFYFVIFYFLKINLFIFLSLAALGLCCCVQAFSSCSEQGLLFVAVSGLLTAVASLVVEHGL